MVFVCLSVRLFQINLETTEPIGPQLGVGPQMTQGNVYGTSKLERKVVGFFFKCANSKEKYAKIRKLLKMADIKRNC